jgi:DNA-directed RNA polymerase specialized sigma subunit
MISMQKISRETALAAKTNHSLQMEIIANFQKQISYWIRLNGVSDSRNLEDIRDRAELSILETIRDYDGSAEFSTFVYNRIRDGVQQGIADTSHISRVKPEDRQFRARFQKKKTELAASLGYNPSHSEVLQAMGYTGTKLRNYLRKLSVFAPPTPINRAKNSDSGFFDIPDWTDEKFQLWKEVVEELNKLPQEEREAIQAMKLNEETAQQFGATANIRPKEAYTRMYSGIRKLKAAFA